MIPWYEVGVLGAAAVGYDLHAHNTPLKQATQWAWPIIAAALAQAERLPAR